MAKAIVKTRVRCAIYTRKSTEDGLEQEYNSLDAQYDACAAYIVSQRHEGWVLMPDRYDDGGFSGGNMERPGVKRLMADVAAGKVDTIVIYKVDRLTRSLADFAKIVEVLDKAEASFVSITQSFNTTTSMGRLTLNMLLSFAQFEREVTGERIRDKIAASKRKGLWMGGPLPLGYDVHERKLVINETEAALVRRIFERYLALASVKSLVAELERDGHRTKLQQRASGPHRGGCTFRRGTLYHLLANRIYRGMIVHKGEAHPGEHPAIVSQELWDRVQAKLAERGPGKIGERSIESPSILIGLLFDGSGRPMTPTHARNGARRYRYYVTREPSQQEPAWRVSAHDLEQIVIGRIEALLRDRHRIARLALDVDPRAADRTAAAAAVLAGGSAWRGDLASIGVDRIDVADERLSIEVDAGRLLKCCGLDARHDALGTFQIDAAIRRVRRGHELRLIVPGEKASPEPSPERNNRLVALLSEAREARSIMLAAPERSLNQIATGRGRCRKRFARLIRLSWLAPDIVVAIAEGRQPADLTAPKLLALDLPIDWQGQRAIVGPLAA